MSGPISSNYLKLVNPFMIKETQGSINGLRVIFKGDNKACLKLFKEAVLQGDSINQIRLSQSFYGMKWGNDLKKDFSNLNADDLEEFAYYPRDFILFNSVYDKTMNKEFNSTEHDLRGHETFLKAANEGYLPAILELVDHDWGHNINNYGFAVQLRPFVGKGDKLLDFYFGRALKKGCRIGSELYYEGMYWMNSYGIPVKFPSKNQSFKEFVKHYVRFEDVYNTYYEHDGFYHVGPAVVLAPSIETWETFYKEKIENCKIASLESYQFNHDLEEITCLFDKYKIRFFRTGKYIKPLELTNEGFWVDSLSAYFNDKSIGKISVREDTFEIYQTLDEPTLKPMTEFIEYVMKRSGSASSAYSWLDHLQTISYKRSKS